MRTTRNTRPHKKPVEPRPTPNPYQDMGKYLKASWHLIRHGLMPLRFSAWKQIDRRLRSMTDAQLHHVMHTGTMP